MIKKLIFRVLLLSILVAAVSLISHQRKTSFYPSLIQEKPQPAQVPVDPRASLPPEAPLKPYFFVGEQILYSVVLGKMTLGEAKFSLRESIELNGQQAQAITFDTKLIKFADSEKIYFDPLTLLPLQVQRDVWMFPFPEKIVEHYDQKSFTLTINKTKFKRTTTLIIKKDSPIHNAILLPYVVRTVPVLYQGWSTKVNLPTQRFEITLVGIEEIKVPAGTFSAFHFQSTPRKFEIWISNDEQRVPLKIKGMGTMGYSLVMKKRVVL